MLATLGPLQRRVRQRPETHAHIRSSLWLWRPAAPLSGRRP